METTEIISEGGVSDREVLEADDSSDNESTNGHDSEAESFREASGGDLKAAHLQYRAPVQVNLQSLLQAGVHFGHQTSRWCPKMAPYIHTSRNGVHIINLPKTIQMWEKARKVIEQVASEGGSILFVATKKQAQKAVEIEARRCGSFFVSRRWLGGMLTNLKTIRKSIERLNKIEQILQDESNAQQEGRSTKFTKKERLMMSKEREKLEFSLGGIREMHSAPRLMIIVDIKREDIAILEAKRLNIPVIALVDTNCDPNQVEYPIPANDDGTRSVALFMQAACDAVLEGKKNFKKRVKSIKKDDKVEVVKKAEKVEEASAVEAPSEDLNQEI